MPWFRVKRNEDSDDADWLPVGSIDPVSDLPQVVYQQTLKDGQNLVGDDDDAQHRRSIGSWLQSHKSRLQKGRSAIFFVDPDLEAARSAIWHSTSLREAEREHQPAPSLDDATRLHVDSNFTARNKSE